VADPGIMKRGHDWRAVAFLVGGGVNLTKFWLGKAKFHYASWFGAGSELKFGLSSSMLAAN